EKPFPCAHCGMSFRTTTTRNNHVRLVHKIKAYSCLTCGEQFNRQDKLRKHLIINEGHTQMNEEKSASDSLNKEEIIDEDPMNEQPGPSR
ncbi:hypothetical protein PMAYCL1PPCAC_01522, partial [Pristionchus mayeri]